MRRNVWTVVTSALVLVAMSAVAVFAPTGFVARTPSQPVDLLDTSLGKAAVSLAETVTWTPSGTVFMPTLSQTPQDQTITLPQLVGAYLSSYQSVLPRNSVYPPGQTADEAYTIAATQAEDERIAATVTALREAGVSVTPMPKVASIRQSGPAYGRLEVGDFISAVDGKPVSTKDELTAMIRAKSVGSPIAFTVLRAGQTLQITMNTMGSSTDGKISSVAITPTDGYFSWTGVNIDSALSQPGGSQGLSLALAVYVLVAREDILNNRVISAAGTVTLDGHIDKVLGVNELAQSAHMGGAELFVVPWTACPDLVNNYGNMRIVPASTFLDALRALRLTNPDSLPSCPPR